MPKLIPEEAQKLHNAVLFNNGKAFKLYHPRYDLTGTGFDLDEAARSLLEQILKKEEGKK
ncbi:MAG TPA: hypothetical protein VGO63_00680 [Candidatus Paceibacterota bacterium]|jgi:hypothetical protein|nr:hypothetical protein [Candidatus Paceibacterota bacterium]